MIWDYIIIGAGSAGCALAHQIAKSGRTARVLILEAGGSDRSLYIKVPAGVSRACAKFDWGYEAQPDPSRNGAKEHWTRGKVLGGSSSINGTIYVRGAADDFDCWSADCSHRGGWSAREVMPIFRDFEGSDQADPFRGQAGPLRIRTVKRPHAITQAFIQSACAAGYPFNEDYNGRSQEGVSPVQFTQRRGLRCSAADAFLKPLLGGKSIRLLLNALVEKIEFVDGRAVGVIFRRRGKRQRETARDIILCAGVINTPKLLMLSGVGDPEELRRCKIDVVLDLPAVGRNLKDHQYLYLAYRSKIPTYNPTEGLLQKFGMAANFVLNGEGPISNIVESIAFVKSSDNGSRPDIQIFFQPVGFLSRPGGDWNLTPYPSIGLVLANSYPVSSGRVRLASADPGEPPLIEYPLLESQLDVDAMIRGVQTIRRIMNTNPISNLINEEILPGGETEDRSALEAFIRSNTSICKHSIGTCRMGLGADAVVEPDLLVRGTRNLWIADASIIPNTMSANTNAACMMIGAKLGKQLVA
jgi:choline dehydrogenase